MKTSLLLGISIALAACAEAPDLVSQETLAPAANSQSQIRHVHGPASLAGYTVRPVKGPEDWRNLNDQQSPAHQEDN